MLVVFSLDSKRVVIETSLVPSTSVVFIFPSSRVQVKTGRGTPLAVQESIIGAGERMAESTGSVTMVITTAREKICITIQDTSIYNCGKKEDCKK